MAFIYLPQVTKLLVLLIMHAILWIVQSVVNDINDRCCTFMYPQITHHYHINNRLDFFSKLTNTDVDCNSIIDKYDEILVLIRHAYIGVINKQTTSVVSILIHMRYITLRYEVV